MRLIHVASLLIGTIAAQPQISERARRFHRDAFVFDGHVHVIDRQLYHGGDIGDRVADGQFDLPRAKEGGIDAMLKRLGDPGTRDRIRAELTGGGETLLRGLDWSDIMVAYSPSRPDAQGRRIAEIAAARGQDPLDAFLTRRISLEPRLDVSRCGTPAVV